MFTKGMDHLKACKSSSDANAIFSGDNLVSLKVCFLENEKIATGIAVAVVDAPIEVVAAWEFLKSSRASDKLHREKGGLKKFIKRINNHSLLYANTRDLKITGVKPREFRSRSIWRKVKENKVVVVYEDTDELDEEVRTARAR